MGVVIGIDAGTTGVRAMAVDEAGLPVAMAYRALTQHLPRPGWVEHDPVEIWESVQAVLAAVATEVAGLGQPVAAIGMTNQRETVVAWDRRSGDPLCRAIVWSDRRTATRCAELAETGNLPLVRKLTGLVLDPYFSATKIEWMLHQGGLAPGPDLALGTVDSWVVWKLTGGGSFVTDASNASRTMLFDIEKLVWSRELCSLFGVPLGALAEVRPSAGRLGVTAASVAGGLPAGIPVSGLAGDQAAALFGQACHRAGMVKCTYGTGAFVLANVGPAPPASVEGLLTSVAWDLSGAAGVPESQRLAYALEGSVFSAGSAIDWLRGLGVIAEAREVGPLAASVPDSGGLVLVPAFTGLGAPWWDPHARGTLVGVTAGSGRAQFARAALESIAFQVRDVLDAIARCSWGDGGHFLHGIAPRARIEAAADMSVVGTATDPALACLRVDGGVSVVDLLLQMQADQAGVPVARPLVTETTALGAAQLAGLAEGVWGSLDEVASCWRSDVDVTPRISRARANTGHRAWLAALSRSRGWEPGA